MNQLLQKSKKNLKNKKGFTLIELIIVIVIIGILAAIIIPRLSGFSDTAQEKANLASARTVYSAAAVAKAAGETETDIESLDQLVAKGYLESKPVTEAGISVDVSGSAIEVSYKDSKGNTKKYPE